MNRNDDFTELSDPEFLAERKRVREALQDDTQDHAAFIDLSARYEALDAEFLRRAAAAWARQTNTQSS